MNRALTKRLSISEDTEKYSVARVHKLQAHQNPLLSYLDSGEFDRFRRK